MDPTESLLIAWRASPDGDRAVALCRVLGARAAESPDHRKLLGELAPQIASRLGREVPVQLELARACIAAGDMFLSDAVLKPLLQIAPNDPQVWRLLGEVFLRAGNARDAETAFEGAIARGLRDTDTMRWHEKARGCRSMQDSGGHPAVAAEVERWIASWSGTPNRASAAGAPPGPQQRLVESPDSQQTVVRALEPPDLDATMVHEPSPEDLANKNPDSDRTAFYVKPELPEIEAEPDLEPELEPEPEPPVPVAAPLPIPRPPPLAAPLPPPPPPAPAPAAAAAESPAASDAVANGALDEESMDIDVLKLPEGDKLDEMLEALRKSEGLVIEEPTGFYQVPQLPPLVDDQPAKAPDVLALAQQGKLPNVSSFGTLMMPSGIDAMGPPGGAPPAPPPPRQMPMPMPGVESPSAAGRRVESPSGPSGVIINPMADAPVESSFGVAPTVRGGPDHMLAAVAGRQAPVVYGPGAPPGIFSPAPPPASPSTAPMEVGPQGIVPPLPLGPGPKATTVRPPKPKQGGGAAIWIVVAVVIAVLGSAAYYLVRVRGLGIGATPRALTSQPAV